MFISILQVVEEVDGLGKEAGGGFAGPGRRLQVFSIHLKVACVALES